MKTIDNYNNLINRYKELDIPSYVNSWAYELHKDFMNTLYYANLYIFPLTPEGEE